MPFTSQRIRLILDRDDRQLLEELSRSRTELAQRVERAKFMLSYADGETISAIARMYNTNRPKVERCIDKGLEFGIPVALDDFQRTGRPADISPEAKAWLIALACQKPKDLGYSYELWTTDLLSKHVKKNCRKAGHSSLRKISRGTVSKILSANDVKPHKIKYYLERRDPDFDRKMVQVLHVYKKVHLILEKNKAKGKYAAILSFDEKPGIQAIGNTAPDLPPVPGKHAEHSRDHEYVRHGTVTLLAAIDLLSGHVHGFVSERHRSCEFILFLTMLDNAYPKKKKVQIILDNHSAHISAETRKFLSTKPNRFEFTFTPTHGSWLNIIESFFAKMTKTVLRGIRVSSQEELMDRILQYLKEINQDPTPFRWKYGLDAIK